MSGRKEYNISITNVQWEGIQRAVRTAQHEAQNAKENIRQTEAAAAWRMQDLQNRCNQEIQGLTRELQDQARNGAVVLRQTQDAFNARMRQQEQEQAEALRRAQETYNRRLHEQEMQEAEARRLLAREQAEARRRMEERFGQELRNQKTELERELGETRIELQGQITGIIQNMEEERRSKAEIAASWIHQARLLLNDIDGKYRHRLFAPGERDSLACRLEQAENNNSDAVAMSEAALVAAQDVCNGAIELRERVIIAEAEWLEVFDRANRLLAEADSRITALEGLEYTLEEDGKEVRVAAEIDRWSYGGLSGAKDEIASLQSAINEPDISLARLQDTIAQIKHLDEKITELESEGRNNFLASELRREIGAEMEERLPGWDLEEVFFLGEDERNDLHLLFRHRNGEDHLSLTITGGQEGKDSTTVTSDLRCTSTHSMETRDGWVEEITGAIHGFAPDARRVAPQEYVNRMNGDLRAFDVETLKQPVTVPNT
ncbi:MAG: hypothetical protein LBF77_10375 [Spirochaetaceae bacterium]|jgi:hypothetical protein|nr:hypothetical protein [Spirochaetaceae bacterium]